jgi:hypothetical protein
MNQVTAEQSKNMGCSFIIGLTLILVICLVLGILLLVGRFPLSDQVLSLWRSYFLRPVTIITAWAIVLSAGNDLLALTLIALANLLVLKPFAIVTTFFSSMYSSVAVFQISSQDLAVNRLRQMFGDDLQNATAYLNKIELHLRGHQKRTKSAYMQSCGCIFSMIVGVFFNAPFTILVNLAFYNALQRFFIRQEAFQLPDLWLGPLGSRLAQYLPLTLFSAKPEIKPIYLGIACVIITLVLWYVSNFSISGWLPPRTNWVAILASMLVSGALLLFLSKVLLVYGILSTILYYLDSYLTVRVWHGIPLNVRGFFSLLRPRKAA